MSRSMVVLWKKLSRRMNKRQNQIEELRGLLAKAEVKISMAYSRDNQY